MPIVQMTREQQSAMTLRNVLVFPAGTEIGLEIHSALKHCRNVNLFGAGQDVSNHARFAYASYHCVRSIYETGWIDDLAALCAQLQIHYIFPGYDDVIVALARERSKIPAAVVSSPLQACETTRSKSATYRALRGQVRVPNLFASLAEVTEFPVFVKPDRGQGSAGVAVVRNARELASAVAALSEPIICEYLPGEEYTVDCFSDRDRGLLYCGARARRRIRNGISVNTVTVSLPEAESMAHVIGASLGLRGAWFFQLRRAVDGELTLLEVAPRIAGAMAAHRVLGVNFALLSILEEERLPIVIRPNVGTVELDRALKNRYRHSLRFDELYVDLDDTIIVNEKVNTEAVRLIYQCVNRGQKVTLLTRHRGDLAKTLAKHKLSGLFDTIIQLGATEKKSAHIRTRSAIFVDDSFAERTDVGLNCLIPTFDCSMIELLTEQASDCDATP